MTVNHNLWRDQQLRGFKNLSAISLILEQEQVMLNFVKTYPDVTWQWLAPDTEFKKYCQQHISISDTEHNGIIVFGPVLNKQTTLSLITTIKKLTSKCDYAYVAINRYEVIHHDLDTVLPDRIDDSLDTIMHRCDPKFKRLHTFDNVDGNHMVGAHPMDCYGLCR
jgi:tetrahydromethanopterin S-methyltransferase subunit B